MNAAMPSTTATSSASHSEASVETIDRTGREPRRHRHVAEAQSGEPPAQDHRLEGRVEQRNRDERPRNAAATTTRQRRSATLDPAHDVVAAAPPASSSAAQSTQADRDDQAEQEGTDHDDPEQHATEEQPRARSDELALQVAIMGVAQLEALEARLRPRIGEPERERDHGHQKIAQIA